MHQERNIAESIMSIYLDVTGFMKDNVNVRKDLAALCDCPSLYAKPNARGNLKRPKVPYCLKSIERKDVLRWSDVQDPRSVPFNLPTVYATGGGTLYGR
jgi:hypothetical protein